MTFLNSLLKDKMLGFSSRKRRWVWDEERIRSSMDVTGNVLHLLVEKMSGLEEGVQLALKVAACFGISMKDSVVGYLSSSSISSTTAPSSLVKAEFSSIRDGLDQVVKEGFMMKVVGTSSEEFKFVHDKVQEAAYSLIPENERNQYHYILGMALRSAIEGKNDLDEIIFSIVDQINHGILENFPSLTENIRNDHARLYEMAGAKAVVCSDHAAARSYVSISLSLMPMDRWTSEYEPSLRRSMLLAKSANSFGDLEMAQASLREILANARCIQDKLPAFFLLVTTLIARGEFSESYSTCHDVLTLLGEQIPDSLGPKHVASVIAATSRAV
eukprot:CAMPEP_0196153788 /NCGR_PEP_ID=MMETSP0910-20130528/37822_1 /TAXON_ID=49265 /ORGANISM="Thalassiosira rotula, Strain GSO102" /LENGTH=328 /DNA_ID=CAMNT_0041417687 /DNA_START=30 /DNA_END=1013 /DNA_ORIENTATION=+